MLGLWHSTFDIRPLIGWVGGSEAFDLQPGGWAGQSSMASEMRTSQSGRNELIAEQ